MHSEAVDTAGCSRQMLMSLCGLLSIRPNDHRPPIPRHAPRRDLLSPYCPHRNSSSTYTCTGPHNYTSYFLVQQVAAAPNSLLGAAVIRHDNMVHCIPGAHYLPPSLRGAGKPRAPVITSPVSILPPGAFLDCPGAGS
jgi:hypothetical protein